jgi:hypothetical protein
MSTDEMPEATRKYFQEAKEDMIRKLNPCRFCAAKDEEFASLIALTRWRPVRILPVSIYAALSGSAGTS